MNRKHLEKFAHQFAPVEVKFRCGIETFDVDLREKWVKGVGREITAIDVAKYFQGVCLLCGTVGESKEHILSDIEQAKRHFEYISVNLFNENSTPLKPDADLQEWFKMVVYPQINDDPQIEVLINNTDLGVG